MFSLIFIYLTIDIHDSEALNAEIGIPADWMSHHRREILNIKLDNNGSRRRQSKGALAQQE